MTHRVFTRRLVSIFAALLGIFLVAVQATAEENVAATSSGGPALIALVPEKPEVKQYDLRYKLKRGDVLRYEITHRASIRSTIEQETQAAQTRTDSVKLWKVTDVLKSGEIEFINVVERVQMINQLPDRDPTKYDSDRDKNPPPGFEDAAKAIGVPLSIVRISPRGKVIRRDLKVRGPSTDEDAPVALRLPEEPVAIGDTWDEPFEVVVTLENGGTKSIQTRRHHELVNVASGIATIKATYQVLSPIDAAIECQLVQRLMEGEVKFDIEAGRVVGQRMDIDKRILGFAGPTSSMQYIMRMEEKLLEKEAKIAAKPAEKSTASQKSSKNKTRTATRPRSQQGTRTYRR
ncbi:MAG: hypothetical protein L0228_08755 [Planctomycetes bacterium]|nr:hypothetical protein [Planctomycetota bacterium]